MSWASRVGLASGGGSHNTVHRVGAMAARRGGAASPRTAFVANAGLHHKRPRGAGGAPQDCIWRADGGRRRGRYRPLRGNDGPALRYHYGRLLRIWDGPARAPSRTTTACRRRSTTRPATARDGSTPTMSSTRAGATPSRGTPSAPHKPEPDRRTDAAAAHAPATSSRSRPGLCIRWPRLHALCFSPGLVEILGELAGAGDAAADGASTAR